MQAYDLTFARYEVLTWLATDPESSVTLSWISRTLRIPPATVTNIIDRLERQELVRRIVAVNEEICEARPPNPAATAPPAATTGDEKGGSATRSARRSRPR